MIFTFLVMSSAMIYTIRVINQFDYSGNYLIYGSNGIRTHNHLVCKEHSTI